MRDGGRIAVAHHDGIAREELLPVGYPRRHPEEAADRRRGDRGSSARAGRGIARAVFTARSSRGAAAVTGSASQISCHEHSIATANREVSDCGEAASNAGATGGEVYGATGIDGADWNEQANQTRGEVSKRSVVVRAKRDFIRTPVEPAKSKNFRPRWRRPDLRRAGMSSNA